MTGIFNTSAHGSDPVTKTIFTIAVTISCLMAATTCVSPAKAETLNAASARTKACAQTDDDAISLPEPDAEACDAVCDDQTDAPQAPAF